ncbi:hypothetical protein Pelo_16371 [Pelomyxa schiedti]|nr:hypothetical protein Pelo_16371 [Pelomyxa schiedti]
MEKDVLYACPLCTYYKRPGWRQFASRKGAIESLRQHLWRHDNKAQAKEAAHVNTPAKQPLAYPPSSSQLPVNNGNIKINSGIVPSNPTAISSPIDNTKQPELTCRQPRKRKWVRKCLRTEPTPSRQNGSNTIPSHQVHSRSSQGQYHG